MRKPMPFGKYLLLDRIAVGGMAEVFAAKTFGVEGFERLVAIKRILPTMAEDEEFISMFIDEARIAAMLQHANLVQIFDLGKHDDTFFIAMEYISGRDVRLLIDKYKKQKSTMPIAMACYIMARIAEGLDYAHRKKDNQGRDLHIIHRDVSPQNVLVSYEGEVKIIDFGIAKAAGRLQKTQAGILKGKFGYMSPEQVRGLTIDHRSDIYSAGVMFYEMLTGTKLFTGESDFSTLEKVRAGEVPSPSAANPAIPPALERIVLKALAKERDERYQWATELHDDLTRFLYSGDEIYSAKGLAAFMRESFGTEHTKEQDRQKRWWATAPEETADFDLAASSPPVPVPAAVAAAANVSATGQQQKVRIGPPSAFHTEELRLQDRTNLYDPGGKAPSGADRSELVTEAVSLADLGMASGDDREESVEDKPTQVRPASTVSNPRNPKVPPAKHKNGNGADFNGAATLPPGTVDLDDLNAARRKLDERNALEQQDDAVIPVPPPTRGLSTVSKVGLVGIVLAVALFGGLFAWKQHKTPALGAFVLSVSPRDGLTIEIDGEAQSAAIPLSGKLPEGKHELRIAAEGYEPHEATFVVGGKPLALDVTLVSKAPAEEPEKTLTPAPGVAEKAPPTDRRPVADARPSPVQPAQPTQPVQPAQPVKVPVEPVKVPTPEPVVAKLPPEKPAAPKLPGTLVIFAQPAAIVAIDGKAYGKTPVRAEKLPSDHPLKVELVSPGYKRLTVMQEVPSNGTETLRLTLEKADGAAPAVASGEPAAVVPAKTPEPTPAPAAAGGNAKVIAMCVPVAQLLVDGKPTNRWTPISQSQPYELPAGKHVLTCETNTGKRSAPKEFEMAGGQTYKFTAKIE